MKGRLIARNIGSADVGSTCVFEKGVVADAQLDVDFSGVDLWRASRISAPSVNLREVKSSGQVRLMGVANDSSVSHTYSMYDCEAPLVKVGAGGSGDARMVVVGSSIDTISAHGGVGLNVNVRSKIG